MLSFVAFGCFAIGCSAIGFPTGCYAIGYGIADYRNYYFVFGCIDSWYFQKGLDSIADLFAHNCTGFAHHIDSNNFGSFHTTFSSQSLIILCTLNLSIWICPQCPYYGRDDISMPVCSKLIWSMRRLLISVHLKPCNNLLKSRNLV